MSVRISMKKRLNRILILGAISLLFILNVWFVQGGVVAHAEEQEINSAENINENISSNVIANLNNTPLANFTQIGLIGNSSYFYLNPLHYNNTSSNPNLVGKNKNGVCTTVAMQLLLGYHNYYSYSSFSLSISWYEVIRLYVSFANKDL